jgi:hypothetical protein
MDPWLIDSFQNRPQGIPRMNRGLKKGSSLVSSRVAFMLCGGRLAAGAAACGLHSPAGALRGSLWSQRGNGAASSSTGIVAGDVGGANHPRMQVAGRSFHGSGSPLREEAKKKKGMFYELGVIFSKERAAERRAALKEEITRGQFHEIKELDKTGGKIFDANLDLIPEYESVVFPNFDAKTLDNKHVNAHQVLGGKVSLVTVSLREIARPMVNTWTTHFHSKHGSHPNAQVQSLQHPPLAPPRPSPLHTPHRPIPTWFFFSPPPRPLTSHSSPSVLVLSACARPSQ